MKIDNQDIVRTARQLRDEENQQLNVQPWNHHRSKGSSSRVFAIPSLPTWLVAIPAAAIIGFIFGFWTKSNSQLDSTLTALVDTVYIKVHDPQPLQDSVSQAVPAVQTPAVSTPAVRRPSRPSRPHPTLGRPVADDRIRYDLLVRN